MLYIKHYSSVPPSDNGIDSGTSGSEARERVVVFVEHDRQGVDGYLLSDKLFKISSPFYMDTERWPERDSKSVQGHIRRIRKKKRNVYEEQLDGWYLGILKDFVEQLQHRGHLDEADEGRVNTEAKEMANLIELSNCIDMQRECQHANPTNQVVIFNGHLIPKKCSYFVGHVNAGMYKLLQYLDSSTTCLVEARFTAILDPPWSENKSVKRKRCYPTDCDNELISSGKLLKRILEIVYGQQIAKYGIGDVRIMVWTTQKMLKFSVEQLIPAIGGRLVKRFLWHKVTTCGKSAKVRGAPEYLLEAKFTGLSNYDQNSSITDGILVSIPSAIHSHKPPIVSLSFEHSKSKSPGDLGVEDSCDTKSTNDILCPLQGLELYARYLRTGFHSIGFEVLKLQDEALYAQTNTEIIVETATN